MRILQATPTYFANASVIGGGERYVHNVCASVSRADTQGSIICDMLSFGEEELSLPIAPRSKLLVIPGDPDHCASFAGPTLDQILEQYQVVHIHQCLTPWGIYVAARARLSGALVIGTDHGGGEIAGLEAFPVLADVFDFFHAQSEFAEIAFLGLPPPCHRILGPVDERLFPLLETPRETTELLALGRILPHKGYEHAIDALPEGAHLTIVGRVSDEAYLAFLRERAAGRCVTFQTDADDADLQAILGRVSLLLHTGVHVGYQGQFWNKPELLSLAPLEAMARGVPAIVSQAGALPELGTLAGCKTFRDQTHLSELLQSHIDGKLFSLSPSEIRDDMVSKYGLAAFGERYIRTIRDALGAGCN